MLLTVGLCGCSKAPISATAEEPAEGVGSPVALLARYEYEGGWLIAQVHEVGLGRTIVATDVATGEQKRLTVTGEVGRNPIMAGQRVVWRNEDRTQRSTSWTPTAATSSTSSHLNILQNRVTEPFWAGRSHARLRVLDAEVDRPI